MPFVTTFWSLKSRRKAPKNPYSRCHEQSDRLHNYKVGSGTSSVIKSNSARRLYLGIRIYRHHPLSFVYPRSYKHRNRRSWRRVWNIHKNRKEMATVAIPATCVAEPSSDWNTSAAIARATRTSRGLSARYASSALRAGESSPHMTCVALTKPLIATKVIFCCGID